MKSFTKSDLNYEVCETCHGMWFDFGELREALVWDKSHHFQSDVIKRGDDKSDHPHEYDCAKCDAKPEEREYAYDSGIHIDGCRKCKGVFVSAEALQHIGEFLYSSKHSTESKDAHARAQIALNQLEADYKVKQAQLANTIDGYFKLDDLPLVNHVSEWLWSENW